MVLPCRSTAFTFRSFCLLASNLLTCAFPAGAPLPLHLGADTDDARLHDRVGLGSRRPPSALVRDVLTIASELLTLKISSCGEKVDATTLKFFCTLRSSWLMRSRRTRRPGSARWFNCAGSAAELMKAPAESPPPPGRVPDSLPGSGPCRGDDMYCVVAMARRA